MRSQHEVCREIAAASDQERGELVNWTDERKASTIKFIMLLGLVGRDHRKPSN